MDIFTKKLFVIGQENAFPGAKTSTEVVNFQKQVFLVSY